MINSDLCNAHADLPVSDSGHPCSDAVCGRFHLATTQHRAREKRRQRKYRELVEYRFNVDSA